MLKYLIGRILNNKWLFICLLAGAVIASAIASSIPLYTSGILQRVLTKDLENFSITRNSFPGLINYTSTFHVDTAKRTDSLMKMDERVCDEFAAVYNLPLVTWVRQIETHGKRLRREGVTADEDDGSFAGFVSLNDIQDHIELIRGKLPGAAPVDGVYEVMISDRAMQTLELVLDETYDVLEYGFVTKEEKKLFKIKVVGVYTMKAGNDPYWGRGRYASMDKNVVIDNELLIQLIDNVEELNLEKADWAFYFDYHSIKISRTEDILNAYREQQRWTSGRTLRIYSPLEEILDGYAIRKEQMRITLWLLIIPLMIIVGLYTFMITGLIIKNDSNEISVLKSRGAGTLQIFSTYVIESLFVSLIASLAGPFVGVFFCRVIGASNGFLEFVNRTALNLDLNAGIYVYSFAAGAVFVVCMLVPAFNASRVSIVQYKKSKLSSAAKKPFWQKIFLDVIVLALAGYGYYGYKSHQSILGMTGVRGDELSVDPLLYFISTFFILGSCLLFLRIYPLIIKVVFKIGEKWWNPVAYFSLVNVGRADNNLQFIMVFVVLSLAFGIMNANQARAINRNIEDKLRYEMGAEVVIEPYNNLKHLDSMAPSINQGQSASLYSSPQYNPPPYQEGFKKMEGVAHMTKVIVNNEGWIASGQDYVRNVRVLGIIPHEFGKVAWFRSDLLPRHINEYLNLMTVAPKAVFLSSNIRNNYDIRTGDEIRIRWGKDYELAFTVYGFIDYFPACNPYKEEPGNVDRYFAIMNYLYIEKKLPAQPYEIWIRKNPGVEDGFINKEVEQRKLRVERIDYLNQKIIQKKNDPVLQGTNGVLTMCFIITMLIATTGFIIFWTLSIKEKALKFGIFRAIGLPMGGVTLMMVCEQVLVSGSSAVMGVFLGGFSSRIFIPLLQLVYSAAQQVPPFLVQASWSDYVKVLAITAVMLIAALSILYAMVRHIRVHQVLKLGED